MSNERSLIACFLASREAYDKVAGHLDESGLTEQAKLVVEHINSYYERDPEAKRVDKDLLVAAIARSLPNPKHQAMFAELVEDLAGLEVSPANVVADYIAVRRQAAGNKLATLLASGRPVGEVRPALEDYDKWAKAEEVDDAESREIRTGQSVAELVSARTKSGGLVKVLPRALNERLDGGLLPGHHMLVFARPETGKTMFLVNAIRGFVSQKKRVLYVGNEDPLDDVVMRVVGCLADMTRHEIMDDPEAADEKARENGYEHVVFAALAPGTPKEIEALVEEYEPAVLVIDQLRNLNLGKEENFTRKLELAAAAVRGIGQRHKAVVVSVTQAGDSATDKAVLDMGDVDSSNTGIPAQADVMVGIGMTREDEAMGRRVISLPKNKPGGVHSHFPVLVDTQKSRIRSE